MIARGIAKWSNCSYQWTKHVKAVACLLFTSSVSCLFPTVDRCWRIKVTLENEKCVSQSVNTPFKCIVQKKKDRAWCKSEGLIVREMDGGAYSTGQQCVCLSEDEDRGVKKRPRYWVTLANKSAITQDAESLFDPNEWNRLPAAMSGWIAVIVGIYL